MTLPKQTEENTDKLYSVESYLEVDGCSSATFSPVSFVHGLQTLTISDTESYHNRDETSKDVILFSEMDSYPRKAAAPSNSSSGIGTLRFGSVWDSAGHMALSPTVSTNEDDYDDVFCTKDINIAVDDVPTDSRHRPKSGIWMEEPPDNFRDKDGDTVLHLAVLQAVARLSDLMRLLRLQGQVNFRNRLFQTPLHIAVLTSQVEATEALLDLGASLSVQDCHGNTPLHTACEREDLPTLLALLGRSMGCPDDSDINNLRQQPLDRRKERHDKDLADALVTRNYEGLTCLHIAVLNSNPEIVHLLLKHGADINAKDGKSGRTALHFAVEAVDVSDSCMLEVLLAHQDINVDAATFACQTALQLALGRKRFYLADLLRAHGASWSDTTRDSTSDSYSDDEMDRDQELPYDDVCIAGQPVLVSRGR